MSDIALYNTLRKIPDVASSKDVATKADIVRIEKFIAELETRLVKQIYAAARLVIGGVALIAAVVGLAVKFL